MSTTELQNNIIRKILNTKNDQLLDYVDQLLSKEEMFEKNLIRKNWDIAFKEMHANGDDSLLDNDVLEDENLDEWK